jgi:hypothetical protein
MYFPAGRLSTALAVCHPSWTRRCELRRLAGLGDRIDALLAFELLLSLPHAVRLAAAKTASAGISQRARERLKALADPPGGWFERVVR